MNYSGKKNYRAEYSKTLAVSSHSKGYKARQCVNKVWAELTLINKPIL